MNQKLRHHFADYYDYYQLLVSGDQTVDQVKKFMLTELGKPESTVRRQFAKMEENPGLLIISPSGTMSVDRTGLADLLSEIREEISRYCILEEVPEPDEVNEIKSVTESEYNRLKEKYMQTSEELVSLRESYARAIAAHANLKKRYADSVLAEKVLLMDSVKLDADSVKDEWTFLSDLDYQIDVDKAMEEERKRKSFFQGISDESREEAGRFRRQRMLRRQPATGLTAVANWRRSRKGGLNSTGPWSRSPGIALEPSTSCLRKRI